ncbi:unnamed protein product [Tilletia caries]|nr:unnamed protein product [Tilletia caries]
MPAGGDDSAPLLQPEGTSNNANNDEENAAPAAARTPEQRLAQLHELHFNRTKWLQDLDGSDLSRPERKAATEMAFNILDADQKCQPFEALRLAVENVRKRRHLEEELGKAELEKLKKRKMTDKERRKRRKALKRFDPGKFPKNTFQEIKDSLKDARLDTIEDSHSHASQAASARPASGAGPSRQPSFRSEPSRRSGPTATVSKPFRDNGPRSDNGRALQLLHKHQRHTFATRSRKQKAELEKLKKRKMTDKERRKRRKALKRFDPGKFPKDTFQEIKDSLKDARLDTIEDSHSHASQAASARPASGAGPSRQPSFRAEPPRRSGPTPTVSKPFRDNGSKSDNGVRKACARCGTRERHRPEECTAGRLAYYPGKATHAIRNSSGQLVERSGGRRICLGHNVSGCTWNNCPGEHACSLCGGTCTAQTCRLSRPPQSQ